MEDEMRKQEDEEKMKKDEIERTVAEFKEQMKLIEDQKLELETQI